MFANLSSANASLLPPHLSSNSSLRPSSSNCLNFRSTLLIFTSFSITNILLLLPLCILILHLGLQRWRKQRSASRAAATSHSDVFTYHVVAMEMIGILGCFCYCLGVLVHVRFLVMLGVILFSVISKGQIFFHILSCVERHLAVVHPITYMGLRSRAGVRIRNVVIGCTWLLFLGSVGLTTSGSFTIFPDLLLGVFSIIVISFCSLSVLRSLIRPGPGDIGNDRERLVQSKMRAFYTIVAIMATLLFRVGGHLLVLVFYSSLAVSENIRCGVLLSGVWFCLPSSLVLPLLFLHRAGKLPCCTSSTDPGPASE